MPRRHRNTECTSWPFARKARLLIYGQLNYSRKMIALLLATAVSLYPAADITLSVCTTDCDYEWGESAYTISQYNPHLQEVTYTSETQQTLTMQLHQDGSVASVNDNCLCRQNCTQVMCSNPTRFFGLVMSSESCVTNVDGELGAQLEACVCSRTVCTTTAIPSSSRTTQVFATVVAVVPDNAATAAGSGGGESSPTVTIAIAVFLGAVFIGTVWVVRKRCEKEREAHSNNSEWDPADNSVSGGFHKFRVKEGNQEFDPIYAEPTDPPPDATLYASASAAYEAPVDANSEHYIQILPHQTR